MLCVFVSLWFNVRSPAGYLALPMPCCYAQFMSNSDILGKADRVLRPVLKELGRFSWIRLEGCCAGHKQEDSLWLEINVLGSSGLQRVSELLRILDGKLAGTDCRVDCLLSYSAQSDVA